MQRLSLSLVLALAAASCGEELQVNLIIYDPCNQTVLRDADHIQVGITSSAAPVSTTWSADVGQGELPELPLVSDAIVTIVARESNGAGDPGQALGAAGVGLVDLTGSDGSLVELSVAVGRIDDFAYTTDTRSMRCSDFGDTRLGHSASTLPDGRVLVAGGEGRSSTSGSEAYKSSELYDPKTGAFSPGPEMRWRRTGHAATVLADGRVLLTGGVDPAGSAASSTWKIAQIFDPESGTFDEGHLLKASRAYHTATLLADGRVLLAGGRFDNRALQSTEIFDPSTGSSEEGPQLTAARVFHAAVRVGRSTVAVIGGSSGSGVLGSIDFVDADEGETTAGPTLATARSHAAAALTPSGDAVVIAGGFTSVVDLDAMASAQGLQSLEILELGANGASGSRLACAGETLGQARGAAAIAVIGDELLVAGGVGSPGTVLASAERIRIEDISGCDISVTDTTGPMGTPRAMAQLTPLVGGDVLVSGGFSFASGQVVSLSQAEIYVHER